MLLLAFRALGVAGLDVTCNYAKNGGGIFGDACTGDGVQKYEYNGKELDRTHGLDTYDYGARMYDAALPVWDRPDPLAHKYYHISPYAYCGNNPIVRIDRDGRIWDTVIDLGFIAYDIADAATQYLNTGSVSSTTRAALGADALAAVIPGVTGAGIAVRVGPKTAKVGTNVIKAGEKKTTKSLMHKESSESKRARFVVDSKGNTIDTNMTPRGSYKQPNGDRTDILQKKPHYNKMRKTNDLLKCLKVSRLSKNMQNMVINYLKLDQRIRNSV